MQLLSQFRKAKYYSFRITIENILDKTLGVVLFQYQKKNNMFNWFYNCLKHQHQNADFSPRFNYYEFGVANGGSMRVYILALKKFCKDYNQDINKYHIFGFDSFEGLPQAQDGDTRKDWSKGVFKNNKELALKVAHDLNFPKENLHLIEGYFEKSLTPELKKQLKNNPPAIVNMDADYYSSTITVFNWIQDLLASGTFFRFDDLWSFYGHPEKGVIKAINEFNSQDKGYLTACPILGLESQIYVYCKKEFEYV